MANIKMSELPTATQFNDDDYTMIVQNNTSKKISKENMYGNYKYSTTENVIGQWIDGKPIYRKVVTSNTLSPSSEDYLEIPHGISNIETVVNIKCIARINDGLNNHFDFNNYAWFTEQTGTVHTFVGDTNILINYQGSGILYYIDKAYFILEYTKTTD